MAQSFEKFMALGREKQMNCDFREKILYFDTDDFRDRFRRDWVELT